MATEVFGYLELVERERWRGRKNISVAVRS